jgi:hypothetical protein
MAAKVGARLTSMRGRRRWANGVCYGAGIDLPLPVVAAAVQRSELDSRAEAEWARDHALHGGAGALSASCDIVVLDRSRV